MAVVVFPWREVIGATSMWSNGCASEAISHLTQPRQAPRMAVNIGPVASRLAGLGLEPDLPETSRRHGPLFGCRCRHGPWAPMLCGPRPSQAAPQLVFPPLRGVRIGCGATGTTGTADVEEYWGDPEPLRRDWRSRSVELRSISTRRNRKRFMTRN